MLKFLGKIFSSNAAKSIAVHGFAIPIIGTIVGYEVQKALIKNDQKKALKQKAAEKENVGAEVMDISEFGD